jgi:hypothetical protein
MLVFAHWHVFPLTMGNCNVDCLHIALVCTAMLEAAGSGPGLWIINHKPRTDMLPHGVGSTSKEMT